MADKKFIRELNSLIRIDKRKRLKSPNLRPSLLGGVGIAGAGEDLQPVSSTEYMYMLHYGGGIIGNKVYQYDGIGTAPVLIGEAGGRGRVGFHTADLYGGNLSGQEVYKNAATHISTGLSQVMVGVNSTHIIVQNDVFEIYRYLLDGTYVDTFTLPIVFMGAQNHAVNDTVIGFTYTHATADDRMAISDMSGTLLGSDTYDNISYQTLNAAAKDVVVFVDPDGSYTNYQIKVFNNAGTKIATHLLATGTLNTALGGDLDAIGVTSDRIYLFGRSSGVPNCLIYEHTLTMGGGVATSAALGALLYTVATPQNNNNASLFFQSAAMDGALMA